jgi:hypothetical protein
MISSIPGRAYIQGYTEGYKRALQESKAPPKPRVSYKLCGWMLDLEAEPDYKAMLKRIL